MFRGSNQGGAWKLQCGRYSMRVDTLPLKRCARPCVCYLHRLFTPPFMDACADLCSSAVNLVHTSAAAAKEALVWRLWSANMPGAACGPYTYGLHREERSSRAVCGLCATAAGTHALWVFPKYQLSMCRATAEWGADRGCARRLRMYLFKFEQISVISALHVNRRRVRR